MSYEEEQNEKQSLFSKITQKIHDTLNPSSVYMDQPEKSDDEISDEAPEEKEDEAEEQEEKPRKRLEIESAYFTYNDRWQKDNNGIFHYTELPVVRGIIHIANEDYKYVCHYDDAGQLHTSFNNYHAYNIFECTSFESLSKRQQAAAIKAVEKRSEKILQENLPKYEAYIHNNGHMAFVQDVISRIKVLKDHCDVEYHKDKSGNTIPLYDGYIQIPNNSEGYLKFVYNVKNNYIRFEDSAYEKFGESMMELIGRTAKEKARTAYEETIKDWELEKLANEHPYRVKDISVNIETVTVKAYDSREIEIQAPVIAGHVEIGASEKKYAFRYDSSQELGIYLDPEISWILNDGFKQEKAKMAIHEQVLDMLEKGKTQEHQEEKPVQKTKPVKKDVHKTTEKTSPSQKVQTTKQIATIQKAKAAQKTASQQRTTAKRTQTQTQTKTVKKNKQPTKGQEIEP